MDDTPRVDGFPEMTSALGVEWKKIPLSLLDLCLDTTLRCGQSFRWKKHGNDIWSCSLRGRIISLKQDPESIYYRAIWPPASANKSMRSIPENKAYDDTETLLKDYLNLEPDLATLYKQWSFADPNFRKRARKFTGVRILRQDAWEALVGFICSSNNNIARISQMVQNLCLHYGPYLGEVDDIRFHDLPAPEALAVPGVEAHLRELGFGYRAKYLARTATIVAKERPENWLDTLRNPRIMDATDSKDFLLPGGRPGYRTAHQALLELQGVGPKVADCVCLMGLDWGEALPIDTHVWQIATRDYKFGKGKHKSLTKATYDAIGDHFRGLWGVEAGWAHSVLFAADLRTFAVRLIEKTEVDEEVTYTTEGGKVSKDKIVVVKRAHVEELIKDEPVEESNIDLLSIQPARKARRRA